MIPHPMRFSVVVLSAALLCAAGASVSAQSRPTPPLDAQAAQASRPEPGPVYEIPGFTRAVERGTRTRTGEPGPNYWVEYARYTIDARLDPSTNRASGHERVVYLNNSPDTLKRLAVYLRQNAFAAGSPRNQQAPITGGVTLGRVIVNGAVVRAKASATPIP